MGTFQIVGVFISILFYLNSITSPLTLGAKGVDLKIFQRPKTRKYPYLKIQIVFLSFMGESLKL